MKRRTKHSLLSRADLATIRVNVVFPRIVDTPLYRVMPDEQRQNLYSKIAQQLSVNRVAQPEDIAEAYVYLVKNGCTTGAVLLIDGGSHFV